MSKLRWTPAAEEQQELAAELAEWLSGSDWPMGSHDMLDALASTGLLLVRAPDGDVLDNPAVQAYFQRVQANGTSGDRVYFVKSGDLIKIGFTTNLPDRVRALHLNGPGVELLCSYRGDRALEQALHREFADHRRHGEWFELPADWRSRVLAVLGEHHAELS